MPSPVLQFKRGPSSNVAITSFRSGEPGFTTDRYDFYIGLDNTTANNKFFGSSRYWSREDGTSALKLNLVDKDGTKLISLKSPDTISGAGVTYTLPETIINGYFLKTNSTGILEWSNSLPGSNFSGIVTFTDTTDSTAYTNGAVQIAGGLGVSKSVNIGGNIYVSGISTFNGLIITNNDLDVQAHAEIQELSVVGIASVSGDLMVDGQIIADSDVRILGITTVANSTDSTAFNNGSFIFDGGVGIQKSLNIGQNLSVSGLSTFTGFSDFNGGISVFGISELDDVNVSGTTTVTSLNVTGNVVLGDTSGDIITIKGTTTFEQPIVGTISTATNANYINIETQTSDDNVYYIPFESGIGYTSLYIDTPFYYNPGQNKLTVTNIGVVDIDVTGIATVGNFLSSPIIKTGEIQASDGSTSITVTNGTGAVGFANSVTISGDLYVLGNTTEVNTSELKVEDTLIDLGLVNSGGSLVPPSTDLNLDLGILFNWYNGSAKKASVYWDDSLQRVGIASDITESTGVLTANAYAAVQIKELWVTDCAGTSQVISCTSSQRFLENITVDCGAF